MTFQIWSFHMLTGKRWKKVFFLKKKIITLLKKNITLLQFIKLKNKLISWRFFKFVVLLYIFFILLLENKKIYLAKSSDQKGVLSIGSHLLKSTKPKITINKVSICNLHAVTIIEIRLVTSLYTIDWSKLKLKIVWLKTFVK